MGGAGREGGKEGGRKRGGLPGGGTAGGELFEAGEEGPVGWEKKNGKT